MLPRTAFRAARPLFQASRPSTAIIRRTFVTTQSRRDTGTGTVPAHHLTTPLDPDTKDPGMNGGYPQLPAIKRQHRDPYADWWDDQDRRNFGEPVHEDNDVLGIFATEDYTWTTPGWGAVLMGTFVATFFGGLCTAVYFSFPEAHYTPAVPQRYPGGLDRELGGPGAVLVSLQRISVDDMADNYIQAPSDAESD